MLNQQMKACIQKEISDHKIILYMKGSKNFPLCGFSSAVVDILKSYDVTFHTVDVLSNPEIRNGIKEFSDWPTIPQLYVNGVFLGGCDIVSEMHEKDQLKAILEKVSS